MKRKLSSRKKKNNNKNNNIIMETSAYHPNGSFTHAQTVLNWDPSSLEIKTRSVEKTLEPLVVQVSIFKQ